MEGSKLPRSVALCLISLTLLAAPARSMALGDFAITTTTTSLASNGNELFARQNLCGGRRGYEQCGGNFPDEFCCEASTRCVGFDAGQGANSGAICCPGGSCSSVRPLLCDAGAFNATLHPDNPIHLSEIPDSADLPTCGDGCCPPGYECSGGNCVLASLVSSSAIPSSTVSLSSISSDPAATPTSDATGGAPAAADATATGESSASPSDGDAQVQRRCNDFPAPAVLVGFFPGMILGSLVTFLLIVCVGRRNRNHPDRPTEERKDSDSTIGPVRAHISDPIYSGENDRIDFLRRHTRTGKMSPPGTISSATTANSPPVPRVRSLFSKSPVALDDRHNYRFGAGGPGLGVSVTPVANPRTPERQIRREPSMESIPIMSPPEERSGGSARLGAGGPGVRAEAGDRQTTFGDVLKAVGLNVREPMPFMGSPTRETRRR